MRVLEAASNPKQQSQAELRVDATTIYRALKAAEGMELDGQTLAERCGLTLKRTLECITWMRGKAVDIRAVSAPPGLTLFRLVPSPEVFEPSSGPVAPTD